MGFENSNIVTDKPTIPNNAKGIQIPKISANTPLRNRKNVPTANWMVKIYPKVFPSTVSWVASETKEKAGKRPGNP